MKFKVFTRNWWKRNPNWPNGLEPDPTARKTTIAHVETKVQAQNICHAYNANCNSGKLSRKAEYQSC